MHERYEMTVGLEVHVELLTETKIFCTCENRYGAPPNTRVCPICLGYPGALPRLNRRAVEIGIRAALVCGCEIAREMRFDRKNYFYPDLPKGYQITQADFPLGRGGAVPITVDGVRREIPLIRLHLEEDAGKLMHGEDGTHVDFNRAGVPLCEIVSAPAIHSAAEAKAYLTALRERLLFAGVSDCKMNEGSMRCDVNLSVRRRGETELGTRTELKNLNSIAFVGNAIEYEFARQVSILESGGKIEAETRRYDEKADCTVLMRKKESAADYRYFPEPDIPPITVTDAEIESVRRTLPEMPDSRRNRYETQYGLSSADAATLCETRARSDYFDAVTRGTTAPRIAANLLIGAVLPQSPTPKLPPETLAEIAELLDRREITAAAARQLCRLCEDGRDPTAVAREAGLLLVTDSAAIAAWVQDAIEQNPAAVAQYRAGKTKAAQSLLGHVMRASRGCADASAVSEEILRQLEN